jgi:hypothetical protein
LTRFANVFSSYLETSFDLIETPGTRLKTSCGCYCSYCAIAARAPHLQPKRLASADKSRAKQLELAAVMELAAALGSDATRDGCAALLENRRLREHAAFLAYAEQLLRRCDGVYTGPWVLALWRTFAWKAEGSPKRGFRPTAAMLEQARVALRQALHGVSP